MVHRMLLLIALSLLCCGTADAAIRGSRVRGHSSGGRSLSHNGDRQLMQNRETASPTASPRTIPPTDLPSAFPTFNPTPLPKTNPPTATSDDEEFSAGPMVAATEAPTRATEAPTALPQTTSPTAIPSFQTTVAPVPTTGAPTKLDSTFSPTVSVPVPTIESTLAPTISPSTLDNNTLAPTASPTASPTSSQAGNVTIILELDPFQLELGNVYGTEDWNGIRQSLELYLQQSLETTGSAAVDLRDVTAAGGRRRRRLQDVASTTIRDYLGIVTYPDDGSVVTREQVLAAQTKALEDEDAVKVALPDTLQLMAVSINGRQTNNSNNNGDRVVNPQSTDDSDDGLGIGVMVALIAGVVAVIAVAGMFSYRSFVHEPKPPPPPPPLVEIIQELDDDESMAVIRDQPKSPDTAITTRSSNDILEDLEYAAPKKDTTGSRPTSPVTAPAPVPVPSPVPVPATKSSLYSKPVNGAKNSAKMTSIQEASTSQPPIKKSGSKKKKSRTPSVSRSTQIDASTGDLEVSTLDGGGSCSSGEDAVIYLANNKTTAENGNNNNRVQKFNSIEEKPTRQEVPMLFPLPLAGSIPATSRFVPKTIAATKPDKTKKTGPSLKESAPPTTSLFSQSASFDDNKSWAIKSIASIDDESMAGFSLATMESKEKSLPSISNSKGPTPSQASAASSANPVTGALQWFQREFIEGDSKKHHQEAPPPNVVLQKQNRTPSAMERFAQLTSMSLSPASIATQRRPDMEDDQDIVEQGHEVIMDDDNSIYTSREDRTIGDDSTVLSGASDVYTTAGTGSVLQAEGDVFQKYESEEEDEAFIPMRSKNNALASSYTNKKVLSPASASLRELVGSDTDQSDVFASHDDDDLPSDEMNDSSTRRNDQNLSGFSDRGAKIRRGLATIENDTAHRSHTTSSRRRRQGGRQSPESMEI